MKMCIQCLKGYFLRIMAFLRIRVYNIHKGVGHIYFVYPINIFLLLYLGGI